jgi:hypothetical protein
MQFLKKNNIYKIIRMTGAQNNILGVTFNETNNQVNPNDIEIIEWDFPSIRETKVLTSKETLLEQVMSGLESVNRSLGTDYQVSQIYFSPYDSPKSSVYHFLIFKIVQHYHNGNEFIET